MDAGKRAAVDGGKRVTTHGVVARLAIALAVLWALPAAAENTGIDGSQMAGGIPSCNMGQCHFFPGVPDNDLTVTITGPASLVVNESANYQIEVTGAFGPAIIGAGVFVAAYYDDVLTDESDGILGSTSADTQITTSPTFTDTGQLTHVDAQNLSVGTYSYGFSVLAPAVAGELRLEGAMNAFNGDNTVLGDEWQITSKIIPVPEPSPFAAFGLTAFALAALDRRRARRGHSPTRAPAERPCRSTSSSP